MRENVCLATSTQDRLYAVGSQSHVTLVDDRLSNDVAIIASKQRGCGASYTQLLCLLCNCSATGRTLILSAPAVPIDFPAALSFMLAFNSS